jgi:hypothetical protein
VVHENNTLPIKMSKRGDNVKKTFIIGTDNNFLCCFIDFKNKFQHIQMKVIPQRTTFNSPAGLGASSVTGRTWGRPMTRFPTEN